jgi:hypothetical protein
MDSLVSTLNQMEEVVFSKPHAFIKTCFSNMRTMEIDELIEISFSSQSCRITVLDASGAHITNSAPIPSVQQWVLDNKS